MRAIFIITSSSCATAAGSGGGLNNIPGGMLEVSSKLIEPTMSLS